jgi:DNA-binding CsgD family transcriptional regulator
MARRGSEESAKESQYEALELRKAGNSFRQIGQQLGISTMHAHRHVKQALANIKKLTLESAEDYIALELEKFDNLELRINKLIQAGDLKAIDRALRIADQRAKLLRLYESDELIELRLNKKGYGIFPLPEFKDQSRTGQVQAEEQ